MSNNINSNVSRDSILEFQRLSVLDQKLTWVCNQIKTFSFINGGKEELLQQEVIKRLFNRLCPHSQQKINKYTHARINQLQTGMDQLQLQGGIRWDTDHILEDIDQLSRNIRKLIQKIWARLAPEMQQIVDALDTWVNDSTMHTREPRESISRAIKSFLLNPNEDSLDCRPVGTYPDIFPPDIFDQEPFISRLKKLKCSMLVPSIYLLKGLKELSIDGYCTSVNVSSEIINLSSLTRFDITNTRQPLNFSDPLAEPSMVEAELPAELLSLLLNCVVEFGPHIHNFIQKIWNQLTPEAQHIIHVLDDWANDAAPRHDLWARQEISARIKQFLIDSGKNSLFCCPGVSNPSSPTPPLPDIFAQEPFISRLKHLECAGLVPSLYRLDGLKTLTIQGYCTSLNLSPEIANLSSLRHLNLSYHQYLTGLPNELLLLPSTCEINLQGCRFSQEILHRLQNDINQPGYHGPRISFSIEDNVQHNAGGEVPNISQSLQVLFSAIKRPAKEFPGLMKYLSTCNHKKDQLKTWLYRLNRIADYKSRNVEFVEKILDYLELANNDEVFRNVFFFEMEDAAITCGDRMALSVLRLGVEYNIAIECRKVLSGDQNFVGLSRALRTRIALKLLEVIAAKKVETLRFFDEIEVYLAYPVMLREKLHLLLDVKEMLYFACSGLTVSDLISAENSVREMIDDPISFHQRLLEQKEWEKILQTIYPQEYQALIDARTQGLEEDVDVIDLQIEFDKGRLRLSQDLLSPLTPQLIVIRTDYQQSIDGSMEDISSLRLKIAKFLDTHQDHLTSQVIQELTSYMAALEHRQTLLLNEQLELIEALSSISTVIENIKALQAIRNVRVSLQDDRTQRIPLRSLSADEQNKLLKRARQQAIDTYTALARLAGRPESFDIL